ncbi:uncharacterized protein LOC130543595 [Ursus arctos]|uniref:uncharacterized protein LOC130543595 n=1 Tax=Ursus arctos TaxID=9644 RepID=UPI00254919C7|nr:uncharacterized protein LOC130543595 [Ursus arctos]
MPELGHGALRGTCGTVTARGFQGVAYLGSFSDPPLASKNGPRGRAGHRPLHLQGSLRPRPGPALGVGGRCSTGHRISGSDAPQVSSGHQTSCKRTSLDSARQLGDKSGWRSTRSATLAPFRSHVPGIPRRLDPNCASGWAFEPLALWCWCPPKPSFRGLASPAQASGQQRPWRLGCPSTFHPCSVRLRLEGAPGALSRHVPGSLPVSGLSEASSERCAPARVQPRGCFPLTPPGKVREASAAKSTSRLREEGETDTARPELSGAAAVERRSPWAQAAGKAPERVMELFWRQTELMAARHCECTKCH